MSIFCALSASVAGQADRLAAPCDAAALPRRFHRRCPASQAQIWRVLYPCVCATSSTRLSIAQNVQSQRNAHIRLGHSRRVADVQDGSALSSTAEGRAVGRRFSTVLEAEIDWLHSITSSAAASSVAGTVRPRVLAVLRLITSSNFVGCTIGRSAGFSPLRMRPA